METIHAGGTPLAAYLEGEGLIEPTDSDDLTDDSSQKDSPKTSSSSTFAPFALSNPLPRLRRKTLNTTHLRAPSTSSVSRLHHAWSSSVNSRLGRADNARFLEHFRYIIVASQLLNEYLDQGSLPPPNRSSGVDGSTDKSVISSVPSSVYGAVATAVTAFALVYLINWARNGSSGWISKKRVAWGVLILAVVVFVGYFYVRRQWLKRLRRQAVTSVSNLTANWQSFEVSASSALSLIQEVELVSRGYRLSAPLPPVSRMEANALSRRCGRLRKALHTVHLSVIPSAIDACTELRTLIAEDDLDRYFDVYDINPQDARDASSDEALSVLEDDPDSLKSLRVFSYRASVLRRVTLCSLMALEADGGKSDFYRWRVAIEAMDSINHTVSSASDKIRSILEDMETIPTPISTPSRSSPNPQAREKFRSQVRKISALSSGIRALQAKMQILREETTRSIEHSTMDDSSTNDFGPNLLAQYDAIGSDLRDLQQAWEIGRASLQNNLSKRESGTDRLNGSRPISTSTAARSSPVSSISGLTAVEENLQSSFLGSPADALRKLDGAGYSASPLPPHRSAGTAAASSNRSSMATTPSNSDEELVFEAVAQQPRRHRHSLGPGIGVLSREERIARMQEERERKAAVRARREANTSMMRELESVISLRPQKRVVSGGGAAAPAAAAAAASSDGEADGGVQTRVTSV